MAPENLLGKELSLFVKISSEFLRWCKVGSWRTALEGNKEKVKLFGKLNA